MEGEKYRYIYEYPQCLADEHLLLSSQKYLPDLRQIAFKSLASLDLSFPLRLILSWMLPHSWDQHETRPCFDDF